MISDTTKFATSIAGWFTVISIAIVGVWKIRDYVQDIKDDVANSNQQAVAQMNAKWAEVAEFSRKTQSTTRDSIVSIERDLADIKRENADIKRENLAKWEGVWTVSDMSEFIYRLSEKNRDKSIIVPTVRESRSPRGQ